MNRTLRTGLLALALAAVPATAFPGTALANLPAEPTFAGRVGAVARDATLAVREIEPPAPRKTCPTRSWPNLAPRCVAALDLGAAR